MICLHFSRWRQQLRLWRRAPLLQRWRRVWSRPRRQLWWVHTGRTCSSRANMFAADRGFAMREELPLPSKPPYTAHLGNLSFDATEGDVNDFFAECEVTNVRIVEDKLDRKPKGFGYVEFGSVEGLKKALALSGTQFQGRNVRVSVAEPRTYKFFS